MTRYSGRWASNKPSFQFIPRHSPEAARIREPVTNADYGPMEERIMAGPNFERTLATLNFPRDEIAEVLKIISAEGLPGPRSMDVALDAIKCSIEAANPKRPERVMPIINIEFTEDDLKDLVTRRLSELLGDVVIKRADVKIEVKSKQNYKSEWEEAAFRATVRRDTHK